MRPLVSILNRPLLRLCPSSTSTRYLQAPRLTAASKRFAHSGYGSTDNRDPRGSDPQNQGPNPSADLEHPGPAPVKEGLGTGGGPTKGGYQGEEKGLNDNRGARTGSSNEGPRKASGKSNPQSPGDKSDCPEAGGEN